MSFVNVGISRIDMDTGIAKHDIESTRGGLKSINSICIKLGKIMAYPRKWLGRIIVQSGMHILASSTKSGSSMLASFC